MGFGRKQYGKSKVDRCPFCDRQATLKNDQGVPVCTDHRESAMNELFCYCGKVLELREGKWGIYFLCTNCGIINRKKAFENNLVYDVNDA